MERVFRFGIMGAGNIAGDFCRAVKKTGKARVVAVAGRTPGKAAKLAGTHGIPGIYTDYEEMLKQEKLDAVYIAATTNAHYDLTMLCLDYRVPVLCEKAMFRTFQEADTVFRRSRQLGVFVMEGMWTRFLPKMERIRGWIEEGRIGAIRSVTVDIGFKASRDPRNRYFNEALGGGAMYDLLVYAYDILTYVIRQPVRQIRMDALWTDTGVDAQEELLIQYDGCQARLFAGFLTDMENKAVFYGEKGKIQMEFPHYGRDCWLYPQGEKEEYFCDQEEQGFVYEILEVIACIEKGNTESKIASHQMTLDAAALYDCLQETRNQRPPLKLAELDPR